MESRGQTFPPVRLVDCRSDHIEDGELGIAFADDLREKQPSKILTPTEVGEVFKRLRSVIDDGVKFKEIKRLLA
jgi:hypothetical protein